MLTSFRLYDLPFEQRLPIYKFCHVTDLINLACVSKSFYHVVVEQLWKVIEIPWKTIGHETFLTKNLENLRYTQELRFRQVTSCMSWDILGKNLKCLLEHCCHDKVSCIKIDGNLSNVGIQMISQLLFNIRTLSFVRCKNITSDGWMSLVNMKELNTLEIDECHIDRTGFSYIVKIPNLQRLRIKMQGGSTGKNILDSLQQTSTLLSLSVIDAGAMQPCYIENNTNLNELDIRYGHVNDKQMKVTSKLKHLRRVTITDCLNITEVGMLYLSELTHLESLRLVYNNFSDTSLSHLTKLISIEKLDLSVSSTLTDVGLSHITTMTSLTQLFLHNCPNITNNGLTYISNLINLKALDVSSCNAVTYSGAHHITKLAKLEHLFLDDCVKITDLALHYISNLTTLKHLSLHGCCFISDTGLNDLSNLKCLENLNISMAADDPDSSLEKLSLCMGLSVEDACLHELNISLGPDITDAGLLSLEMLPLRCLDIEKCAKVTDNGIASLSVIKSLCELNLSSCVQITDNGISFVSSLTLLTKLNISCTAVTDVGLSYVTQGLKLLKELNMGYCWLITNDGVCCVSVLLHLKTIMLNDCVNIDIGLLPDNPFITFIIEDDNWVKQ